MDNDEIKRGQFRPRVYADGGTTPPKAERPLADEDWNALLDDPAIRNFMDGLDPKEVAAELARQRAELIELRKERHAIRSAARRLSIVLAYPKVVIFEAEPGSRFSRHFYTGRLAVTSTEEMEAVGKIEDRVEAGETVMIYQPCNFLNTWWRRWVSYRPWVVYEEIELPWQRDMVGVLFTLRRDPDWKPLGHA